MAKHKKPLPSQPLVKSKGVPPLTAESQRRWAFSFRFWRQIEYFGLDKSGPSWFVALLDRLTELSKHPIDDFRSDVTTKSYYHYHPINWEQKNIPIKREELIWLEKDYFDNPEEYPFLQFMISQGLGRVVGFWDENDIFNVVLLDPLHNLQPTKSFAYKIDTCSPLSCDYTALHISINHIKNLNCIASGCPVQESLSKVGTDEYRCDVIIVPVDEGTNDWVNSVIASNKAESVTAIFEAGLLSFETPKVIEGPIDQG